MKVVSAYFYQAVSHGGPIGNKKNLMSVTTLGKEQVELEYVKDLGIKIVMDEVTKIVPFSNVSSFRIEEGKKVEKKQTKGLFS